MKRLALLIFGVTLIGVACSPPAVTTSGTRSGVGTRTIEVDLTGSVSYSHAAQITGGSVGVTYTGSNGVDSLTGTVSFAGRNGGTATATFDLRAAGGAYSGSVRVVDPSASVSRTVVHTLVPVGFDGDGDASGTASAGGVGISWRIDTDDAPGLEPVYDALSAAEDGFCADAQQRLAGLEESEVPLGSIGETVHASRGAFGSSKASLTPLETHAWAEAGMVTTESGNTIAISRRISCKTRSADHLATLGVGTAPVDLACSALNQRSLDLAWAALTPAQRAAHDSSGTPLALAADVVEQTGVEWLTPLQDLTVSAGAASLRAHALLVRWNDPAYQLFPETIRGVHYCTVWSPAQAYWWYTVGAFA
jgi:hypothetical protein